MLKLAFMELPCENNVVFVTRKYQTEANSESPIYYVPIEQNVGVCDCTHTLLEHFTDIEYFRWGDRRQNQQFLTLSGRKWRSNKEEKLFSTLWCPCLRHVAPRKSGKPRVCFA